MNLLEASLCIAAVMFVLMTFAWLYQRKIGEADIVDFVWTCGVGLSAAFMLLVVDGNQFRRFIVGCLILIWSVRLATYLFVSRVLKRGEDGRYKLLREKWKERADFNFFILFQVQTLLVVIFSLVFYSISQNSLTFPNFYDLIAILLFCISVIGEGNADLQLKNFRADINNKGKVCKQGLWRYSRHPNYFFEWLHWCCYPLFAIGSPTFLLSLGGPLLLLFLILKVTGIPPTEKQALISRGQEYRRYQETTSAFSHGFQESILKYRG